MVEEMKSYLLKKTTPGEKLSENTSAVMQKLADVANDLDSIGAVKEAEMIDEFLSKYAKPAKPTKPAKTTKPKLKKEKLTDEYDTDEHHSEQISEPKKPGKETQPHGSDQHHVAPYQQTKAPSLSTRYCPDHPSVMLGRISEGVWQCNLDGVTYNWSEGFETKDKQIWPSGSISNQTPSSTEYESPHRIFDTRDTALKPMY
jgi:hypothetical protein